MHKALSEQIVNAALRAGLDPASMQLVPPSAAAVPTSAATKPMVQPPMMYQVPVSSPQVMAPVPSAQPVAAMATSAASPSVQSDQLQTAVMAERQRICDISSLASGGQSLLASQLIQSGSSVGDAAVALLCDRNANPPALLGDALLTAPANDSAAIAVQAAALLRTNVPSIPPTAETSGPSVLDEYNAIEDPSVRSAFLQEHRTAIIQLQNKNLKKKGGN